MRILYDGQGFRFELFEGQDTEAVTRVMIQAFENIGPIRVVGTTAPDLMVFVNFFIPKFIQEGLSIIALDQATSQVVGVMLNDDLGTPPPGPLPDIERMAPCIALYQELEETYLGGRVPTPGTFLHLFGLGVVPEFQGHGIAKTMVELSLALGIEKGYQVAMVESTGPASQQVFHKHGFSDRVVILYSSWTFGGKTVFAEAVDHVSCILMDKNLLER
jgi:ribosomal protein S18 acetylase RimI-like enzyme